MDLFVITTLFILGIVLYFTFHFFVVVKKLREGVLFPRTAEELKTIRKLPHKPMDPPTINGQRSGIILFTIYLIFVLFLFFALLRYTPSTYLIIWFMMLYPSLLARNLFNLFAFTKDGILSGTMFVKWERIQSYELIKIDKNHRFYGHVPEVNDQYELKIYTKTLPHSCIIISDDTLDKTLALLEEQNIELREPEPVVLEERIKQK